MYQYFLDSSTLRFGSQVIPGELGVAFSTPHHAGFAWGTQKAEGHISVWVMEIRCSKAWTH